jgi:outer membrane protein assembly factor BamA
MVMIVKILFYNFTNVDFSYAITVDKRNQVFQPTEGYKTTFTQSLPLIQDSSSVMNGLRMSAYHDFSEDLIGSIKFCARTIHGV